MNTNKKKTDTLRIIGDNIRKYRNAKGWSQEDLALECDLHRTYIGSVERGQKNITILNLLKIKDKLGVKLEALYPE